MTDSPNILFMTSHDTGDWLGCYDHPTVNTPNLDMLASEGCRCANAFCTSPVCTPSRGSMMTGRYPQSNGLMGLIQEPYRWRYNDGERHLSHLLKEHGYETVLFNHQHEAPSEEPLGFLQRRAFNSGTYALPLLGETVCTAEETANSVAGFLTEHGNSEVPFYAQIGFFETHTPFDWNGATPDDEYGVEIPHHVVDGSEIRERVASLQGAIKSLDRGVGQILNALSDTGLDSNTIVVFAVDHGVQLPRCKWELYDGGIHTALILRWPQGGVQGGRICDWLISNVDLVPTLLELANLAIPKTIQGKSFAGSFSNGQSRPPRNAVYSMMTEQGKFVESRCVRTRNHKLIRNFSPSRATDVPIHLEHAVMHERPFVELYDLIADPHEMTNLGQCPEHHSIRRELDMMLMNWCREVDDPILKGPIVSPYFQMATSDFASDPVDSRIKP